MVIKLSSTVAVSCRPRSGRAQAGRLDRASSSPSELTGHKRATIWQEWHGRVVVTRRSCIRKKLLQALLDVVLLVMVGSETSRVGVGLMSASWQMGDTRYGARGSFVIPFFSIYLTSVPPRPPISLIVSRSARPTLYELVRSLSEVLLRLHYSLFSYRSDSGDVFFPLHLFSDHFSTSMFAYAPRLVQQRAAPPVYERTPSQISSSVPHSRTPSLHPSPAVPQPIPTRHSQTPSSQSIPVIAPRHSSEPWVDALKEDVESEFNLSLVDDVKAVKDAALASATTPEERVAIQREFNESMADIRALARAELQRRVEAERERRLLGNFHGKDALVAEQHTIMDSIVRENMRRDVSHSLPSTSSLPQQDPSPPAQPQPHLPRQSQPIPIPVQPNSSRNGIPSIPRGSSVGGRSVSIGNGPIASSSSSSPRAFPSVRRDSITQHAAARPFQSPIASPASSLSSVSNPSEESSVGSTHDKNAEVDRRYQEHRAAVQKREKEVQLKEAAALRYAEEARRREEAAARHEEHARRKNEEATRRIREAEQREQQVRAWETRTRKEIAQKEAEAVRTRTRVQSTASAAVPRMTRVFSEEWQQQQQQQRLRAGTGVPTIPTPMPVPQGEVKVRV